MKVGSVVPVPDPAKRVRVPGMDREEDVGEGVESAAGEMEASLEEMETRSEEVGERVDETRSEWERKQQDSAVPGAEAGEDAGAQAGAGEEADVEEVAGDWEGQGPAADEAGQ
jgi:hypothetical protein